MHCKDKYSQFNHLASLAKWLSVRLQTKRLWIRTSLLSLEGVFSYSLDKYGYSM